MNLSFFIARRYLFSKKSHNAINIISMIAVCGVAVATMATVCAMSVMNGFNGMITDMFSAFDPELKITPVQGKVFDPTTDKFLQLREMEEIAVLTETLEEHVLLQNRDRQVPAVLKGVSENFGELTQIESILFDGSFTLQDGLNHYVTLGYTLGNTLGVINADFIFPLKVIAPKRNTAVNMTNPMASLHERYMYISGIFIVDQPMYDENYALTSLTLARELFDYDKEVSALEIKLKDGVNRSAAQKRMQELIGNDYAVKDLYQQQEASFKMMRIEKFVIFLILCFIVLIAVFNIIGSLSMLMVDKQNDILTLRNLGADNKRISRVFLYEGWLISALGAVVGIVLGVLLCLGQQQFGWIRMGSGADFVVPAYPIIIESIDLVVIFATVLTIGFFSVAYPVRFLSKKWLN